MYKTMLFDNIIRMELQTERTRPVSEYTSRDVRVT